MQKFTIIIPTLNEVDNIRPLLQGIEDMARRYRCTPEVIFVDDGSEDSTCKRILYDYEDIISDKDIEVSVQLPEIKLLLDYEKIHRLFINLIDNGIKYNRDNNGWLRISASQDKNEVAIDVSNSGETIPEKDLTHIFKQFYRVEKSRSQAYGGTGLGLTIARRIVEMHGGTLSVTSIDNRTTFRVTLSL